LSTYAHRLLQKIQFSKTRILSVLPQLTLTSFDEGEAIWNKGHSVQSWNCVMTGYVAASLPIGGGKPLPVHIYGPMAWFGEQPLLNKQPTQFEYTCLTPVEVIGMNKKSFESAILEEPDFVRYIAMLMAWRAQQQSEMLMLMRLGSSPLRVVMGLAQYAEALDCRFPSAAKNINKGVVDIPITQSQIAALCGVSRTLFSEYLQHLARAGWLKVRYGGIELQSVQTWRIFARKLRECSCVRSRASLLELLDDMDSAQEELGPRGFPNLMNSRVLGLRTQSKNRALSEAW
jgi:CRP/FNR family cyclic AMP-dependent transcriptional regulator